MLGSGLSVLYVVDERGILVGTVEEMDVVRALIRHT
jgi:CBS domain-containing protein